MTLADEAVWVLYQAEKDAYYEYVASLSGDALVQRQRVSRHQVVRLRAAWRKKLHDLYQVTTPVEVQGMLQRRGAGGGGGSAKA